MGRVLRGGGMRGAGPSHRTGDVKTRKIAPVGGPSKAPWETPGVSGPERDPWNPGNRAPFGVGGGSVQAPDKPVSARPPRGTARNTRSR